MCEFNDKVRQSKREIVKAEYRKLNKFHQDKFVKIFGDIESMHEGETYRAYYHCKQITKKAV